jgi:hypothetical protein
MSMQAAAQPLASMRLRWSWCTKHHGHHTCGAVVFVLYCLACGVRVLCVHACQVP